MPQVELVPACPRCEGIKTGVILYGSYGNIQRVMAKNAAKGFHTVIREKDLGQIIDFLPNCICTECGFEWSGKVEPINLTGEEYKKFLEERGLSGIKIKKPPRGLFRKLYNYCLRKEFYKKERKNVSRNSK